MLFKFGVITENFCGYLWVITNGNNFLLAFLITMNGFKTVLLVRQFATFLRITKIVVDHFKYK